MKMSDYSNERKTGSLQPLSRNLGQITKTSEINPFTKSRKTEHLLYHYETKKRVEDENFIHSS